MRNIKELYREAIDIESKSESPRIRRLHDLKAKKYCKVTLGIIDPEQTEYLVMLKNPGGRETEYELTTKQDIQKSLNEYSIKYSSVKEYIECCSKRNTKEYELLAYRSKVLLQSFNNEIGIDCTDKFGLTNTSIYHSHDTNDFISYYIEREESYSIVKKEIDLSKLKFCLLSGVGYEYFFDKLYSVGSVVEFKEEKIGRFWFNSLYVINGRGKGILYIFTIHLTGTYGLSNATLETMGRKAAKKLKYYKLL